MSEKKLPLMPKATAVWLVDNTALTFKQIAQFCGLHELEVQGIADGDVAQGIIGQNPIFSGQLSKEGIESCEQNPEKDLALKDSIANNIKFSGKKSKYTPIARRQDKPDAIAFLIKYHPELTNANIKKLVGTTDSMIESIRSKTHWNMKEIKPRDIVLLGLCSQSQFNEVLAKAKATALLAQEKTKKAK